MNVRSRSISVTLVIGVFTTMGWCRRNAASLNPRRPQLLIDLHSSGVPSIRLEINSTWLLPSQGDIYAQRFSQLLQGLTRYIRNTNDTENGACRAGGV